MKTKIIVGLCIFSSFVSARAENDNPAQATARAALEQKLAELNNPQAQSSPSINSAVVEAQPVQPTTDLTPTVAPEVAAPVIEIPVATIQSVAAPVTAAPITETPITTALPVPVAAKVAASVPPAAATATLKPTVARTSTKSFVSAVKVKSGSKIVTTSGTVYENVEVEKKTSDGMYISYSLSGGGIAVSKIFFNELSPETLKFYASK